MEIEGKVFCLFEQSGTFKNEFRKMGFPAEDFDIQNNFGETDKIVDLFEEIEKAFIGNPSLFDTITKNDLIISFFPCIHFCDAKTLIFKGVHKAQRNWSLSKIMRDNIEKAKERELFFETLLKFVAVCSERGLRLIIENPYNTSGDTFLQNNFVKPSIIDKDRSARGDYFVKPTANWFINCKNTEGFTEQRDKEIKIVYKQKDKNQISGICSEARSMISPDYARNLTSGQPLRTCSTS